MQLLSVISTLSLIAGSYAWASDGHGTWVANNKWYNWRKLESGGTLKVHEACTIMNRNDMVYENAEPCAYWTNAQGGMFRGHCTRKKSNADILIGCY